MPDALGTEEYSKVAEAYAHSLPKASDIFCFSLGEKNLNCTGFTLDTLNTSTAYNELLDNFKPNISHSNVVAKVLMFDIEAKEVVNIISADISSANKKEYISLSNKDLKEIDCSKCPSNLQKTLYKVGMKGVLPANADLFTAFWNFLYNENYSIKLAMRELVDAVVANNNIIKKDMLVRMYRLDLITSVKAENPDFEFEKTVAFKNGETIKIFLI